MNNQIIDMRAFKFDTLHKYMTPLYSELEFNIQANDDEKQEILKRIVPKFLKRLREYRNIAVEDMARHLKLEAAELEEFEKGNRTLSMGNSLVFLNKCNGTHEFEVFQREIRNFKNPGVRQSQDRVAVDVLKKFGILMAGVNYKRLHEASGTILELKRKRQ